MSNIQLSSVDFHGQSLTVITSNAQRLIAMKPICEGIGLGWQSQYNRIQRNQILREGVVIMNTPSAGGEQETTCLPLDYINGWLFGIDVSRCREEIRPTLIQYQRECYAALAAYWQDGVAVRADSHTATLVNELIGMTELNVIKGLIRDKAKAVPDDRRKGFALTMHSRLHTRFNVPRTELIPAGQFESACNFIAAYVHEGEWIGKESRHQLNLNYPIATLAARRADMLTVRNADQAWLDVTLHDLRDIRGDETPCEKLLGELDKAGYDIEGCWWELRTYRNKIRELASFAIGMSRVIEDPHRYAVTPSGKRA